MTTHSSPSRRQDPTAVAWPITYEDVLAAERRVRPYLAPTPLRSYAELDAATGCHVLVKHENHQPTNAFKVRNGLSALTGLSKQERSRGVVAASTGNHGQGVAWAGRAMGVPVTICVPRGVSPDKIAAMRGFGAEVVEEGQDYDDAIAVMQRLVQERGLYPVHGVNHPLVPAGAGTMMLEVLEQAAALGESIDAAVVAIGGGSQAVGAMTVLRARQPAVEVFGVQAAGAPTMHDAWRRREPAVGATPATFAEGVATRSTYELTFGALCEGLRDFVTVSDAEMAAAMRLLIRTTHQLAEPAGAASAAGLTKLTDRLRGKTVVVVLSGANVDLPTLRRVVGEEI